MSREIRDGEVEALVFSGVGVEAGKPFDGSKVAHCGVSPMASVKEAKKGQQPSSREECLSDVQILLPLTRLASVTTKSGT